jgi:hypothetical protein
MNTFSLLLVISSEVQRSREIWGTAFGINSERRKSDSSTPLRFAQSDRLNRLEVNV